MSNREFLLVSDPTTRLGRSSTSGFFSLPCLSVSRRPFSTFPPIWIVAFCTPVPGRGRQLPEASAYSSWHSSTPHYSCSPLLQAVPQGLCHSSVLSTPVIPSFSIFPGSISTAALFKKNNNKGLGKGAGTHTQLWS